jgi:Sulfatase
LLLGAGVMLVGFALPLGAWTKLHGPHRNMALAALVGSVLVGAAFGAHVYWSGLPRSGRPAGRGRWLVAVGAPAGSLLVGLLLAAYEATQTWLRSYPSARQALFGMAWWCATAAVLGILDLLHGRVARGVVAGACGVAAFCAAALAIGLVDVSTWATLARQPHAERWIGLGRGLADFDRDGFSGWLGGGDCAPFNALVSPGAAEVRGNGVDDNCRYGDAPRLPIAKAGAAPPTPAPPDALDIVLITVDALRADRTTPYGYERNTTPNLAAFAKGAVRYQHAYTPGGWTSLAVASLFAGVYPRRMRWKPVVLTTKLRLVDLPFDSKALGPDEAVQVVQTLPAEDPPWWLPLTLQQRGYHTAAIGNRIVGPMFSRSFRRGWERFAMQDGIEDAGTVELALAELAQLKSPYFLWVHLFEPHEPQTEHPGVPSFGPSMSDKYDHEVASADRQLGRLLAAVDAAPRTAVIVTADHGESFASGFQLHGVGLWEDVMHIPLLVRAPGWLPGVNLSPSSLVDLAPTILALTRSEVPAGLDGRNLKNLSGDASVITDLFRIDERGRLTLEEMTATNSTLRLWHDHLRQSDALVRTGDLTRPPVELPAAQTPPELSEALARHIEGSLPP